ncbi:MAG: TniQ family protein, partial [Rhizobiaceae bacterium]|nr:TniQ family protein [Rhizobiaceae bacterium]
MTRLARTVRFHDDEHVASLLSRLAMMNGASTTEFCRHLGLNPRALAKGRSDVLNELAHLGGFDPAALKNRLPIFEKDVFQIGNERLLFSHVDRIRGGYCPHCVARDRELGVGAMETRAYGRLSWLVRFIATCPIHNALLCAV